MTENMRNFLVGVLSSLALLGLAGLLMSFGELEFLFQSRYPITINTTSATGLRAGSPVELHGVSVGVVESVSTQANPQFPVRIVAHIDHGIEIPADAEPAVSMQLIGAVSSLQFRTPDTGTRTVLPTDGTAEISRPMHGGMFAEVAEQLDARIGPLLDSLERFNQLSDTFVALGDNLNDLLLPQTAEQIENGESPNIRTAVVRINEVLEQANEGLQLANSLLGDEQLRTDARTAVRRAGELIEHATTAVDRYSQLAHTLENDSRELMQRLLPVMDTLAVTLEEVQRVSRLANEGQGTVGQLLNNPDLYNSLNDAAVRLDRTLIELQVLIQQLRAEGFIFRF